MRTRLSWLRPTPAARQQPLTAYATTPGTGADKVLLASEIAEQAKQIAVDGIRARHSDLPQTEVHQTWLRMLHGELVPLLTAENQ